VEAAAVVPADRPVEALAVRPLQVQGFGCNISVRCRSRRRYELGCDGKSVGYCPECKHQFNHGSHQRDNR